MNRNAIRTSAILVFAVTLLVAAGEGKGQEATKDAYIKAHYTKYEYRIPMRDGENSSPQSMYRRTPRNQIRF
jgi:hypothetical protein